jgi:malonyl-CoA decarboxylase
MPDEPLIFVEVALSVGIADRVGPLLDLDSPVTLDREADTAIFYSISACQDGLAGVSLGDFLIKQVVTDLTRELPGLKCFATLSPIPGFRTWLTEELQRSPSQLLGFLDNDQRAALADIARLNSTRDQVAPSDSGDDHAAARSSGRNAIGRDDAGTAGRGLARVLESTAWVDDPAATASIKPALVRLAARYLTATGEDQRVVDRVGNFHLTNGARIERVNWLANTSLDGLRQSLGLMVNYRYDLDRIERNHTDYVVRGRVSSSPAVGRLLG